MWDYTEKVLEHARNPRNVGVIKNPDGVGEVGSLACGDALKLTFKLDDSKQRIVDAKFQTFGCMSAIASSSALTEMIIGMALADAERITNQDIANYLGGLPEQKMHCSVMGREALEVAIRNFRTGAESKKILEGKVICTCFGVTQEEIEHVVRENDLTTVEQVTNYCKAGGGCGHCKVDISDIIARLQNEKAPRHPTGNPPGKKMTALQRIRLVEETLEREIRPMLRKDGGDIDLIDLDGARVIVALRGVCAHCHAAEFTIRDVVQSKLREFVSEDLVVEEDK